MMAGRGRRSPLSDSSLRPRNEVMEGSDRSGTRLVRCATSEEKG